MQGRRVTPYGACSFGTRQTMLQAHGAPWVDRSQISDPPSPMEGQPLGCHFRVPIDVKASARFSILHRRPTRCAFGTLPRCPLALGSSLAAMRHAQEAGAFINLGAEVVDHHWATCFLEQQTRPAPVTITTWSKRRGLLMPGLSEVAFRKDCC